LALQHMNNSGLCAPTGPTQRERMVPIEMNRLGSVTNDLSGVLSTLEQRLESVLLRNPKAEVGGMNKTVNPSLGVDLADEIANQSFRVQLVVDRLDDILSRLEL
jgi:hypothetical protein